MAKASSTRPNDGIGSGVGDCDYGTHMGPMGLQDVEPGDEGKGKDQGKYGKNCEDSQPLATMGSTFVPATVLGRVWGLS